MKASIIIRTKNEERWIASCLRAVFNQAYPDFEVILVDNKSSDKTLEKVRPFNVRVLSIDDYRPGKALNLGIRASNGQFIVCLSGHCIPVNNNWLDNLIRGFDSGKIAGVYGRQRPMSYSNDLDKRDLITVFGLDRRVQKRDSFFHNANSAIRRDLWELVPFDEEATNIEDRIWAKEMISRGYELVYEPEAAVFHYHGIHQGLDAGRCRNVVRIIESLDLEPSQEHEALSVEHQRTTAIIPVRGPVAYLGGRPLIEYTLEQALSAKYVDRVVVSTDDPQLAEIANKAGASQIVMRPPELSADHVDLDEVLTYTLGITEADGVIADVVLLLDITYPFRPPGLIDRVIHHLVETGVDSVLPARPEYKSIWKIENGSHQRLDAGFLPRKFKTPIHIGLRGLGFATRPEFVREGNALGENVALLDVEDPLCALEVRDEIGFRVAESLVAEWYSQNYKKQSSHRAAGPPS